MRYFLFCLSCFLVFCFFWMLTVFWTASAEAQQCGIMPIKPITPIGCRDLAPMCVCDLHGLSCHWQWVCVR